MKGRPRDASKAGLYMQRARCHMELRRFHDAMDDALDSVKLDENRLVLVAVISWMAVSLQSSLEPSVGKQHWGLASSCAEDGGWLQAHSGRLELEQLHTSKDGTEAAPNLSSSSASINVR